MSDIVEVWTITDRLDENRVLDPPRPVHHSTRGPMCPNCGILSPMLFLREDGKGCCSSCAKWFAFMACPHPEGFFWSTWPLLDDEGGE